jgi:hypothetical protein
LEKARDSLPHRREVSRAAARALEQAVPLRFVAQVDPKRRYRTGCSLL